MGVKFEKDHTKHARFHPEYGGTDSRGARSSISGTWVWKCIFQADWSDVSRDPAKLCKKIKTGDASAIEFGLVFVEVQPYFFRSQYIRTKLIRHLKHTNLSSLQLKRLKGVLDLEREKKMKRRTACWSAQGTPKTRFVVPYRARSLFNRKPRAALRLPWAVFLRPSGCLSCLGMLAVDKAGPLLDLAAFRCRSFVSLGCDWKSVRRQRVFMEFAQSDALRSAHF